MHEAAVVGMLRGLAGLHLGQIFKIPVEIAKVFEKENPPGFVRNYEAAMQRAIAS
jgi:hypothetical protein